jgi:hypothetical protein
MKVAKRSLSVSARKPSAETERQQQNSITAKWENVISIETAAAAKPLDRYWSRIRT